MTEKPKKKIKKVKPSFTMQHWDGSLYELLCVHFSQGDLEIFDKARHKVTHITHLQSIDRTIELYHYAIVTTLTAHFQSTNADCEEAVDNCRISILPGRSIRFSSGMSSRGRMG